MYGTENIISILIAKNLESYFSLKEDNRKQEKKLDPILKMYYFPYFTLLMHSNKKKKENINQIFYIISENKLCNRISCLQIFIKKEWSI